MRGYPDTIKHERKTKETDHAVPVLRRCHDDRVARTRRWATASLHCRSCQRTYNERTGTPYNHLQVPSDIVQLVVLWRLRSKLSLRNVAEMVLTRGFTFTHETVRAWEERCAPLLTAHLKAKRRGKVDRKWHVDETYVKVEGRWWYLQRAIDSDGNLVETLLSTTRDMTAAKKIFACALETEGQAPDKVTTDGHDSYPGRSGRHAVPTWSTTRAVL